MKVLLTHPGTQYAFRLAVQFFRLGVLYRFVTGIALSSDGWIWKLLPGRWKVRLSNRRVLLPRHLVRNTMGLELLSLLRLRRGSNMEDVLFDRNKKFQQKISNAQLREADVVVGFDTSSWILSRRARAMGKPFVLDQSIAHPAGKVRIYEELRSRYPEWAEDIQEKKMQHQLREKEELALADIIVVASSFTKGTLTDAGVPASKIRVNPYGVGEEFFIKRGGGNAAICRFLFLGALGARKGVPFLQEVWQSGQFGDKQAEVWLVGPASAKAAGLIAGTKGFVYLGRKPHAAMPEILGKSDVLVFPSFYEGFGQVILEAMAAGMTVITTERTAGPDVIEHGKDGLLVKAGDHAQLQKAMTWCIEHPDERAAMGREAVLKAREFSWSAYGDRWLTILTELTSGQKSTQG